MSQPSHKQGVVVRFNPRVSALSRCLRLHARRGSEAFTKFLSTAEFDRLWAAVPRDQRRRAIVAMREAEAMCYQHDRLPPPVAPPPIGASRNKRWKEPTALAELRAAYLKTGSIEGTARLLRITTDSARLALKRYVLADATYGMRKAA